MDTLEQAIERFEALGFRREPIITADPAAKQAWVGTDEIQPFLDSIKVEGYIFRITHREKDMRKRYTIWGDFNETTGEYLLSLGNAGPAFKINVLGGDSRLCDDWNEFYDLRKRIRRMLGEYLREVKSKLGISDDVDIGVSDIDINVTPNVIIRGHDFNKIYASFVVALSEFGYDTKVLPTIDRSL
ncbi:MAG: hypothetical protein KJ709_05220 [Nanoarchaeota archaeon]|nr:hypothetical protein [Nanoarchaeota archaeon]